MSGSEESAAERGPEGGPDTGRDFGPGPGQAARALAQPALALSRQGQEPRGSGASRRVSLPICEPVVWFGFGFLLSLLHPLFPRRLGAA